MDTQTHALSRGTGIGSTRWNGLTDTGLKTIALAVMVLDHISYFFGYTGQIPAWFSMAGRAAAPLFLFCLVEGFVHTRSRRRYFLRVLAVAVPMGFLLFLMRYGNVLVRPDGFYPENSMMSTFVLLLAAFQGLEWLTSRKPKQMALGALLLLFLLSWPFFGDMAYGNISSQCLGGGRAGLYGAAHDEHNRGPEPAGPAGWAGTLSDPQESEGAGSRPGAGLFRVALCAGVPSGAEPARFFLSADVYRVL